MTDVNNFNNQSLGEEIANSISHGIGALLASAGTAVLIVTACLRSSVMGIVASAIYGFSLIFLFLMSTLYHSMVNLRAKKVLQIFDHCSVFLLILGSYTPICFALLGGRLGWTLWCANALFTALGIGANIVSIKKWHNVSLAMYLLMGWSVVFAVRPLLALVPLKGFLILLAGGLCYSIGVIFYVMKKPRFMHALWHGFVLAGAILHYFFILFFVIW